MTFPRFTLLLSLFLITMTAHSVSGHSHNSRSSSSSSSSLPHPPRCNHDTVLKETAGKPLPTMHQAYPPRRTFGRRSLDEELRENNNTLDPIPATGSLRITLEYTYIDKKEIDQTGGNKHTCLTYGDSVVLSSGKSYTCTDKDLPDSAKTNYIKELMAYAVDKIQSLLSVVRIEGPLSLQPGEYSPFLTVGNAEVDEHANFSDTDLLVYVTMRPAGSDDVYATGRTVAQDTNQRPILGQINWNLALLTPPNEKTDENYALINDMYRGVAFHEMLHVLGFSSGLFTRFRDSNGRAWPKPVRQRTVDGRDLTFLATPRVLDAVRNLYGCSAGDAGYDDLIGAVIEDQGGSGTAGSHWEKAAFMDEVMTGTASFVPVISNVTLAALEDSGWYKPDYSQYEWLSWGENKGCKFSTYSCAKSWPTTGGYFCSDKGKLGCTYNRKAVGGCQMGTLPSLEEKYNYLGTGEVGTDELADYCPYTRFYSNTWCSRTSTDSTPNDYGETYDGTGRCFESSVFSSITSLATQLAYKCYPVHCTSPTDLKVKIGEYWYACPNASTTISPKGYYGKLHCASAAEICPKSTPIDDTFPTFISIEPDTEYPGNPVTIRGTHLKNISEVEIGYKCKITDQSDTSITCTLSSSQSMNTILGTAVDIVLVSNKTSLVVPDGFTPKVAWKKWAEDNAFLLFAMLLSILCLFLTLGIITVKVKDTRAKNKKRQEKRERAKRMERSKHEKGQDQV